MWPVVLAMERWSVVEVVNWRDRPGGVRISVHGRRDANSIHPTVMSKFIVPLRHQPALPHSWMCRLCNIPQFALVVIARDPFIFPIQFSTSAYPPVPQFKADPGKETLPFSLSLSPLVFFSRRSEKKMSSQKKTTEGYDRPVNSLLVTKLSSLMAFCHSSCQSKQGCQGIE